MNRVLDLHFFLYNLIINKSYNECLLSNVHNFWIVISCFIISFDLYFVNENNLKFHRKYNNIFVCTFPYKHLNWVRHNLCNFNVNACFSSFQCKMKCTWLYAFLIQLIIINSIFAPKLSFLGLNCNNCCIILHLTAVQISEHLLTFNLL